jgi:hypothetical protein
MFLDSQVPTYWAGGRSFGFQEGFETTAALGSDTGLVLPRQVETELLQSRTISRLHMGMKTGGFLSKRGLDLDPDPVPAAEPATAVDLALRAASYIVLGLGFFKAGRRSCCGLMKGNSARRTKLLPAAAAVMVMAAAWE